MSSRTQMNKGNLVWLDMEMTGLDPEKEGIIEIATLITDGDLNVVAEGPCLVIHQKPKLLKTMDEWNQNQHGKSGLIHEVKRSKITVKKAEKATLEFVKQYCYPKKSALCGSSIHHDRQFLIKYMPKLNDYLHYRHVDVSTIKTLIDRWYPKNREIPKKQELHRALQDIRESITELRYYREKYFKS
ncbi:MAG: oligoribonuclease [Candidatus Omnitrophota bacterium]|nr:oligoribonuclease [Candidatus Omnitrophota bacterium]